MTFFNLSHVVQTEESLNIFLVKADKFKINSSEKFNIVDMIMRGPARNEGKKD